MMASPTSPTPGPRPAYSIERRQVGPIVHLYIRGTIDETFSAPQLADALTGYVLLDLGGIGRISSFGVRRWMELTQRLPRGAVGLYLLNAPPVLVDQLNMVSGFAGVGQVLSLLAPYACDRCGEERLRVIDLKAAGQLIATGGVPSFNCTACGSAMQFADSAPDYLNYAQHNPVHAIEPVVERYLEALRPPRATDHPGYLKIVDENLTWFSMASTLKENMSVRRLAGGLEGTVAYDFAGVAVVEHGAGEKLMEVLDTAAQTASVILWRVPPAVLNVLVSAPTPPRARLARLFLPCDCVNCGSHLFQPIDGVRYVAGSQATAAPGWACRVCGALTRVPALPGVTRLLSACSAGSVPVAQLEALEMRALSQLLEAPTATEPNPHTPSGVGLGDDPTNPAAGRLPGEGSGERAGQSLQLLKQVGRGGMAEVFLARQVGLKGFEKYVTVKRILPQFAQSADFVEMLFAEARANARLTHPNVVQMFDVASIDGVAHLTMEYVRGPDFKRVLVMARKSGTLVPVPHALRVVAETAAGLHYAHTFVDPMGNPHPVVHRDVSPHNILISLDGSVKLSDFGIAKVNDADAEGTRGGVFKGKVQYASPEQLRGLPLDPRHDVFALGIVLYESLTGVLPFKGEDDAAAMRAIALKPPPDPRAAVPGLPDEVVSLVLRALEKNPDDRFQSANEFRETIEQVMSRYRYSSSPVDVANYVKGLLGERLKDYSPTGSIATSPSGLTPFPSVSPGATPHPHTPSHGSQRRPPTGEVSPPRPSAPAGTTPTPGGTPRPAVPAAAAPASPAAPAVVTPARRRGPLVAAALGALVLLAGGATLLLRGGAPGVEVANLGHNEQLFIDGLLVNPLALHPRPGGKSVVIAVAADGVLKRMGTGSLGAELDLQTLIETAPGAGQTATLAIKSQPQRCHVTIDGKEQVVPVPGKLSIEAGRTVAVKVQCEDGTDWLNTVLAVPGQSLQVSSLALSTTP